MEAVGLSPTSRKTSWLGSNGDSKGSPWDLKSPRNGYGSMESPLAAQLQQAWLQTQLPKRNVPKLDFLSPLPSPDYLVRSSSFSHPSPQSEVYTPHSEVGSVGSYRENESPGAESDPMDEDEVMLQYLSDIMEEEDMCDKKCMYVQCSAYQAMTKELADLISDPAHPSTEDSYHSDPYGEEEKDSDVSSWIDEVLSSDPPEFLEERTPDHFLAQEVSSMGLGNNSPQSPSVRGQPQQQQLVLPKQEQASPGMAHSRSAPEHSAIGHPRQQYHSAAAAAMMQHSRSAPAAAQSSATPQTPEAVESALDLDCPYLENDAEVAGIDYTNGRSGIESLVDLFPLLMQCAQAVAADDVRAANQLINQLRQKSSPLGDGGERMTYYFVEALVARLSGTGARLYTALSSNRPSATEMLKAFRMFVQCNPLPRIAHFFANYTIMKVVKDSDRIHIIDFGILYGVQWPCLMKKLAMREGGPPHVRITGIDFPQPGFHKSERVEETGRRLAAKAKQLGIEFEYHAIAGKWETIQPSQLSLRNDETLVVNSMFRLRNLLDETVMASSPRKMVLSKILSLNPTIFVMGVISAGYNSPFFMARFRETINHFSATFDAIHSSVSPDAELRRLAEREILGREILNVIACEGTERIERAETYRQWQSRTLNAGFKQEPIDLDILGKAQTLLGQYHKNYGVGVDGNWLLTGWKDQVLHGLTAWRPA